MQRQKYGKSSENKSIFTTENKCIFAIATSIPVLPDHLWKWVLTPTVTFKWSVQNHNDRLNVPNINLFAVYRWMLHNVASHMCNMIKTSPVFGSSTFHMIWAYTYTLHWTYIYIYIYR